MNNRDTEDSNMDRSETCYKTFNLIDEMMETPGVIRNMDTWRIGSYPVKKDRVMLCGEGSSRIFPAKNLVHGAMRNGYRQNIFTENSSQAGEYRLEDFSVFAASNSGKTAEVIRLIRHLREGGHDDITGLVAHDTTPIMNESSNSYLLTCGDEKAVAATKSVVEQALFYDILFRVKNDAAIPDLTMAAEKFQEVLESPVPHEIVDAVSGAGIVYFAGRNNGVAEELRLKTNEIVRKKSDYLEGTYAVHGIEEVMRPSEVIIVIDPFPEEENKFREVLVDGLKMKVFAIAHRQTAFRTFKIPSMKEFDTYLQLAAGWNILVEAGLAAGIDLDRPERARKVGNEYIDGVGEKK
jgi:glutamine---fructose-6-phosphate transaminase (isomerizing)